MIENMLIGAEIRLGEDYLKHRADFDNIAWVTVNVTGVQYHFLFLLFRELYILVLAKSRDFAFSYAFSDKS